ncbi:MAG: alpha/beta hydrolase [Alphaproteobacteria bacterium]|nr:alpha/beta hydrolase [Alphaproteobacteria bacterium]
MVDVQYIARSKIKHLLLTLLTAYAVFCIALVLLQRNLMYFPDKTSFVPSEWQVPELQPVETLTADGLRITSWYTPARTPDRETIVFTQGNAGHAGYRNYKVRPWIDAGYGVMMVGYRGFGQNPGVPSEKGLYDDARSVLDWLKAHDLGGDHIVLYGESMGTGVATQMATEYRALGLILESPYTSTAEVGSWRYPFLPVYYLMRDRFESINKIKNIHMPLMIVHGLSDLVVPAKFGRKLLAAANEPKQGVFVPGLGHSDVYDLEVRQAIMKFIEGLTPDDATGLAQDKKTDISQR